MNSIIPRLVNLQELRINLRMNDFQDAWLFITAVSQLKNLTNVELEIGQTCKQPPHVHSAFEDILVHGMNDVYGIHAKLLHVLEAGGV